MPVNNTPSATHTNRASVVTPSATTTPTPAPPPPEDARPLAPTEAAATFEAKAATTSRRAPFNPPPSPRLTDEKWARTSEDLAKIRDENTKLIHSYNQQYEAYLQTYVAGVESAPDLDRVRAFGPPVSYEPAASLPVSQRAHYDALQSPRLANQRSVHEAIGERVLEEAGEKVPGFYAFFEGKVGLMGQAAKERFELHDDGSTKAKTTLQYSVKSPVATPVGTPKLTVSVDPETQKTRVAASSKISAGAGFVNIEADDHGKLAVDYGVGKKIEAFGMANEAAVSTGSSWDPSTARAEVNVKGNIKVADVEAEVKVGAGAQLLTKEYVKKVIDPNAVGFFDKTKLISGR